MAGDRTLKASQEEVMAAKIPLAWRDFCAHLLIPLNECRVNNFYAPWTCKHEKHEWEVCEYKEYKRRVKQLAESKAEAKAADASPSH